MGPCDLNLGVNIRYVSLQVRQAFQDRWGLEPNSGVPLSNAQWQWAIRGIVSGDQLKPML